MKRTILAGLILAAAAPALAQSTDGAPKPREPGSPSLTTPGQPQETIVQRGGPALGNSGPATTGTVARSGLGADNTSNDTAATSNASNPERGLPNVGGGGGSDGGQ